MASIEIRETVRDKYAEHARAAAAGRAGCCNPSESLYALEDMAGAPAEAVRASLGCGVPTAVADLHEGETVLDLGSGGGADVLISARRVGPTGKAIGLDMTDEMLALARRHAARAGVPNVDRVVGQWDLLDVALDELDVEIRETHRVHEHAGSAIVRARKPS